MIRISRSARRNPRDLDIVHAYRAARRAGDTRADRNQPGGRARTKPGPGENPRKLVYQLRADHVAIVEDRQRLIRLRLAASSLISAVTMPSNDAGAGGPSSGATRPPGPGGGPGQALA